MPRVPRRSQDTIAPTAIAGERTPTNVPAAALGVVAPGFDFGQLQGPAAEFFERKRNEADEVAIVEADNKLGEIETALRTQLSQRKGKNALGAHDELSSEWDKATSEIESKLTSPRQQRAFQARKSSRRQALNDTVAQHTVRELDQYDRETTSAAITLRVNNAVTAAGDDEAVFKEAVEVRALLNDHARRQGWSPEQRDEKVGEVLSKIHGDVIERLVTQGSDIRANEYFTKVRGQIRGTALAEVERRLEVASTEGTALRTVDEVWKSLGPKSENDPVLLADMEDKLREQHGEDAKVFKASRQELRSRAEAFNSQQRELTASRKATLLGKFAEGTSVQSLVRSSEYLALGGAEQEQLKSYMIGQQHAAVGRALTNEDRDDSAKAKRGFATYYTMSQPEFLSSPGTTENAILALEPVLGRSLVAELIKDKRAYDKSEAGAAAKAGAAANKLVGTIDVTTFKEVANAAGFKPFKKSPSEEDKEALGRLLSASKGAIHSEERAKGRRLTVDEQKSVMQGVLDRKVMVDRFWGDTEESVFAVKKDDRGDAYLPIEKVPPKIVTEALQFLRTNGAARSGESDLQFRARMTDRIQKAYGAKLLGATDQEIADMLRAK